MTEEHNTPGARKRHESVEIYDDARATGARIVAPPPPPGRPDWTIPVIVGVMQLAGLASIGAGAVHAGAIGIHAEHTTLARLFVAVAAAQLAVGLLALVRGGRPAAVLTALVNGGAVAAWGATRLWDISWISGLEQSEKPQFTDTACAALGAVAALAAVVALIGGRAGVTKVRLGLPALSVGSIAVVAMLLGANHVHSGDEAGHTHEAEAAATDGETGDGHDHTADATTDDAAAAPVQALASSTSSWPRPWDPAEGVDFSGVPGVTRTQELRAAGLVNRTLRDLPRFADVTTLDALGYRSIGDSVTGFEHYINYGYVGDDKILDPTAPESLVYRVDGEQRTLVSAMYIVANTPVDDPELADYGGPLMQWHVHENLCWTSGPDGPQVAGVTDDAGNCPDGTVKAGGNNPMVHVWIVPHECGPFAALEGHGAGQAAAGDGARTDECAHEHGAGDTEAAAADGHDHAVDPAVVASGDGPTAAVGATSAQGAVAYDPNLPIDLSGTPGVTPEQQAYAENLVAVNLVELPQWSDPAVAEAAGFRSIGDGATGHEHFINWDWINDDVFLDPDHPESLVYEPQPDGSRKLVSAMYMLPDSYTLADVPDSGGALMQWHIHSDLCFDTSGEAPRVGGLIDADGTCTAPLVKLGESPMIHVWITPNECGPFAALEGIGAGQVAAGEEHLCDHAHGSS